MQVVSLQQINRFVDGKIIAIAGASRKEKSFSADVAKHLAALNYKLWFINPNYETNQPENSKVQSISQLPEDVKHLLVLTPAVETYATVQQALDKGIENIWIQQTSETAAAIELAQSKNVNLVHHQYIFMFTQPTGVHKFHRVMKSMFGKMPK